VPYQTTTTRNRRRACLPTPPPAHPACCDLQRRAICVSRTTGRTTCPRGWRMAPWRAGRGRRCKTGGGTVNQYVPAGHTTVLRAGSRHYNFSSAHVNTPTRRCHHCRQRSVHGFFFWRWREKKHTLPPPSTTHLKRRVAGRRTTRSWARCAARNTAAGALCCKFLTELADALGHSYHTAMVPMVVYTTV